MDQFEIERQTLERKRALAEALLTQGQTGDQGVAGIFQAWMGSRRRDQADSDLKALEQRRSSALADALTKNFDMRTGKPGETMSDSQALNLMQNDVAPQLTDPVKADPKRAMIEALTSQFPELQTLGKADLSAMGKQKTKDNYITVGDHLVDIGGGEPREVFNGRKPAKLETLDIANPDGTWQMYQTNEDGTPNLQRPIGAPFRKRATASETNVDVTGNAAEKAYGKGIVEGVLPGGKSYDAMTSAKKGLMMSTEIAQAITEGAKTGIAEPIIQGLRRVGEAVGIPNAATASTATLSAALKAQAKEALGSLGNQISDADRQFVTEYTGDLSSDPEALKRMTAIIMAGSAKTITKHDAMARDAAMAAGRPEIEATHGNNLNFSIPNDEIAQMFENAMMGRPTTYGRKQPVQQRSTSQPRPGASAPQPGQVLTLDQYLQLKGR